MNRWLVERAILIYSPFQDVLQLVYENGRLVVDWTLDTIRERAEIDLVKEVKVSKESIEITMVVEAYRRLLDVSRDPFRKWNCEMMVLMIFEMKDIYSALFNSFWYIIVFIGSWADEWCGERSE